MIYANFSNIKTADEVFGNTYHDKRMDKIEGLEALLASWLESFHAGGPKDIVYVAKLQRRIKNLKQRSNK